MDYECTAAGHPEPEFSESAGGFCLLLRSKKNIGPRIMTEPNLPNDVMLNNRQKEVLLIIQRQQKVKTSELELLLAKKVTKRAIQKDLNVLRKANLIEMRGSGKNAFWIIL